VVAVFVGGALSAVAGGAPETAADDSANAEAGAEALARALVIVGGRADAEPDAAGAGAFLSSTTTMPTIRPTPMSVAIADVATKTTGDRFFGAGAASSAEAAAAAGGWAGVGRFDVRMPPLGRLCE